MYIVIHRILDECSQTEMATHGIGKIDLVIMNLYPFAETGEKSTTFMHSCSHNYEIILVTKHASDFDTCIENIDIGGPSMLRCDAFLLPLAIHCGTSLRCS
jgi:phosphoribosylaminoimidazolecarboxamide formyltransferase/IMP cyclohydrolase